MHFQAESLVRDGIDEQWTILGYWWNVAFILFFFVTPILLVISEESENNWSLAHFMIPTSISWVLLLLTYALIRKSSFKFLKKVKNLHITQQTYSKQRIYTQMGHPKGRITSHCSGYTIEQFENRTLLYIIYALLWGYVGIILKAYVFDMLISLKIMSKD